MKYFTFGVIGVVILSVIAGFILVGSPVKERTRRLDSQRISDLQMIQSQVLWFWQNKGKVPEKLGDLRDDLSGNVLPRDPEKGSEYEYHPKTKNSFTICAEFSLPGANDSVYPRFTRPMMPPAEGPYFKGDFSNQSFQHEAGRTCFDRTIDEELYKQKK